LIIDLTVFVLGGFTRLIGEFMTVTRVQSTRDLHR
jgi:hypothetical protein